MKKFLFGFSVLLLFSYFSLLMPSRSYAQPESCTGLSGRPGQCYHSNSCFLNLDPDGQTCSNPSYWCCTDQSVPPPIPITPYEPTLCYGGEGIETAIGCIPSHPLDLISIIQLSLTNILGGIALILMIIGAFYILTSSGNPEQLKRGKEIFVGAVIGLLFIIFSNFILNLIGVDILNLFDFII